MELSLFRVIFVSEVNIDTRECHLDLEAEDEQDAEDRAIGVLEYLGVRVPDIKSVRELIED